MKIAAFLLSAIAAAKKFTENFENHQNLTGRPVLAPDDVLISIVQEKGKSYNKEILILQNIV